MNDVLLGALITVIVGLSTILGVLLKKKPSKTNCPDLKPLEDKVQAILSNHETLVIRQTYCDEKTERTHENIHKVADILNEVSKNIALLYQAQNNTLAGVEKVSLATSEMMKSVITLVAKS